MDVKTSSPLLPLRDIVVFPSMVIPLFVGRDKSISALNEVMKKEKKIILVTQKNSEIDDPKKTDIFMYGCEGSILQLLKLPDGTVKVLVEGVRRVKIIDFKDNEKFINFSLSLKSIIFTLRTPSTKTFTVPSGSFKSCKMLPSHPYINISVFLGSSISEFF